MVTPIDLERFRNAVHFKRVRTLELELAELKFRLGEIPMTAVDGLLPSR
jgi:hypothetical protein